MFDEAIANFEEFESKIDFFEFEISRLEKEEAKLANIEKNLEVKASSLNKEVEDKERRLLEVETPLEAVEKKNEKLRAQNEELVVKNELLAKKLSHAADVVSSMEVKNTEVESFNSSEAKKLTYLSKSLQKKKKDYIIQKDLLIANSKRKLELEKRSQDLSDRIKEVESILKMERAKSISLFDVEGLEDKNEQLSEVLKEKENELAEVLDSPQPKVRMKITRTC